MKLLKIINNIKKKIKDKIKDKITKEVNDWKYGLNILRIRLEEADCEAIDFELMPREVTQEEFMLLSKIRANGSIGTAIHIPKYFTSITFKDVAGKLRTWEVDGHLSIDEVIEVLMDSSGINSEYFAISYVTHRHACIDIIINHFVLPDLYLDTGEIISEVRLHPDDIDGFQSLIHSGVIQQSKRINMSVKGTNCIVDEFDKRFSTVA
nr:hypothetical protein [uncultured Lachnoclostridium sp.]